ncbi:MAG: hypothetical protein PHC51_01560 [bacterium]|nr:hypothetical protein [bacterium]
MSRYLFLVGGLFCGFLISQCQIENAHAEAVALIVHPSNGQSKITTTFIARVFQGRVMRWPDDGQKIFIVAERGRRAAVKQMLRAVFREQREENDSYQEVFKERGVLFASEDDVVRFVAATPNSLGIVHVGRVNGEVSVMAVDGYRPDDKGYGLR